MTAGLLTFRCLEYVAPDQEAGYRPNRASCRTPGHRYKRSLVPREGRGFLLLWLPRMRDLGSEGREFEKVRARDPH